MFSLSNLFQAESQNNQIHSDVGRDRQCQSSKFIASPRTAIPGCRSSQLLGGGWRPIRGLRQRMFRGVRMRSQVSILKITNANRDCWWYVKDPRTGKSFYAQTLSEAVDWIETHRLGG